VVYKTAIAIPGPINEKRLALNPGILHKPPIAAVFTVIAVIPEGEIIIMLHDERGNRVL
jgi:hypothetical protein